MKINKNYVSKGALALMAGVLMLYSCKDSFLEIPVTGQLDKTVLAGKLGLEASLIAAYSQVNGRGNRMASPSNWVWGSIRGGDANKGTDPGDFSDINPIQIYEPQATQGVISDLYNGSYEGIARTNSTLRLLLTASPDVTANDKTQIEAQAKFLRAHYYFMLKINFGNTPYVDETIDIGTGIEKVKNDVDLWPKIEDDLKFASANLPATQGQVGRVNSWAAKAYLAKVYMHQKKFTDAKGLYDDIIPNGKTSNNKKYGLVAKYAEIFKASNDNHEESVWAYQAAANTGSINNANPEFDLNFPHGSGSDGPGNCCGFFQPSFELANSFRTSGGLPLLNGIYNTTEQLKTDMGVVAKDAFFQDSGELDPRLDHSIGRRYIQYLDWQPHPGSAWIRNQSNGGPYAPKKYVYYKAEIGKTQDNSSWTPGYTAVNFTIIRFADVLLMAAEAEVEVGSLAKALEYVNLVRTRAANPAGFVMGKVTGPGTGSNYLKPNVDPAQMAANYVISNYKLEDFSSKAAASERVRFERKLELSGEGHRFYDLVRWGVAKKEVDAYLAYEGVKLQIPFAGARFDAGKDELLPLPQNQIDLLGADIIKQNPGFGGN